MNIGKALSPLRDDDVLILGSGYTFHNMQAFFNPSKQTVQASIDFNEWLKETILNGKKDALRKLEEWDAAPGGRLCHPREEHLMPLLMVAAAGTNSSGEMSPLLIHDTTRNTSREKNESFLEHAVTGYLFQ